MYLHRDVLHTDMLQPHFISCIGVSGAGGNIRGSRNFCQFYLVLSLFYSYQRDPMVLLRRKLYLYFTKNPEGVHYFPGGGMSNFFQGEGVQMLISIETHVRTCYFPGGGCPDPLSPSGSTQWQYHYNGTIFITVPLLSIIVRHWFVRINDRWSFPNDSLVLRTFDTFEKLLEVVVFAIKLFFSPKHAPPQRSEWNTISDWLIQSKKDGKDQESIQSSTTPDPGYQWESNKLTARHHKREPSGKDNL